MLVAVVEELQKPALDQDAEDDAEKDGGQEYDGEAAEIGQFRVVPDADEVGRQIGAETEERAVRDVQDLLDPENHRQPDGDHEQVRRIDEAVDNNDGEELKVHCRNSVCGGGAASKKGGRGRTSPAGQISTWRPSCRP